MTRPKFLATSVKHAWAAALIAAAVLAVAGCEFPGAEQTALPATPTPAARALASPPLAVGPEATRLNRAATPSAGEVATTQARATARQQATVEAWATRHAVTAVAAATARARISPTPTTRIIVYVHRESPCTTGLDPMRWYGNPVEVRWAADGTHVLFTYNSEVWAAAADGSRVWRIARARREPVRESDYFPGWMTSFDVTPNGQHVVYATCAFLPERLRGAKVEQLSRYAFDYELAVVGLDGPAPRRLTSHVDFDNYPAWSPDGRHVAFLSNRHLSGPAYQKNQWADLYIIAADGTDVRRLDTGLISVVFQPPAWSPDGRSIAVTGWRQGAITMNGRRLDEGRGLYVVQTDGSGFMRLADAVSGGAWSPDSTRLAFAQPFGAEVELYTIAADGADPQRVTTIHGWQRGSGVPDARWQARIHTLAWSPDGSKLLYACGDRQFCVVTLDGEPVGATATLRGEPAGGNPLLGERAVWSPDGKRIAVASPSWRGLDAQIVLYSAAPDGSDAKPLALRGVDGLVAAQAAD